MSKVEHRTIKKKRKMAVRGKMHGTADKPRVSVFRSNKHVQLQAIDDDKGGTIVGVTDIEQTEQTKDEKQAEDKKVKKAKKTKKSKKSGTKTDRAVKAAQELAKKLKAKKIKQIVFDRGPYRYQGRVKAVAEALREAGLEF